MQHPAVWYLRYAEARWNAKRHERFPAIGATALLLVSQGCDQLLIPSWTRQDEIRAAISDLPRQLGRRVRMVDSRGSLLRRVEQYVEPLQVGARKIAPPRHASFADHLIPLLYQLALAEKYGASVVGHDCTHLIHRIHELDFGAFKGDARLRLAEVTSLLTAYEPVVAPRIAPAGSMLKAEFGTGFSDMLQAAEFEDVVAKSGYLGLAKRPKVALRALGQSWRRLLQRPKYRAIATGVSTLTDLATGSPVASTLASIPFTQDGGRRVPPLLDISYWDLDIYDATLAATGHRVGRAPGGEFFMDVHKPAVCGHTWGRRGELRGHYDANEERRRRLSCLAHARQHAATIAFAE